jgi:hypothetical protein
MPSYRAPAEGPTVNLFAGELIGQRILDGDQRVSRLVLALHRGAELPTPVAPSTIDSLLVWAEGWADAEMVAGRDTTREEMQAAWGRLAPAAEKLEPSAVPQPPSVSS